MSEKMVRRPEPELMDDPREALAYARADFGEVNAKFVCDLLRFVGNCRFERVVDLGCGPADIALRIHRERPRWQIVAMDGAMAMLRIGREAVLTHEVDQRVNLVLARAQRLPLPDRSVDLVLSNSLLHHLPDPLAFWREIRRIASAGAFVFIRDLMRPENESLAREIVRKQADGESELLQEEFYRSLLSAFTPAEIHEQLEAVGMSQLEIAPSSDRHVDVTGAL